jgi:hypothetical protein
VFARRFLGQPPPVLSPDFFVYGRELGNYREMRFEAISLLRIATDADRLLRRQTL